MLDDRPDTAVGIDGNPVRSTLTEAPPAAGKLVICMERVTIDSH